MFKRIFTEHPASVGETYWQHFLFATRVAIELIFTGFALLIHALLPFLFVCTASNVILRHAKRLEERCNKRCSDNKPEQP